MLGILRASEMKELDRRTIEEIGVPSAVLMERAALAVAEEVLATHPGTVLVAAGSGNNGGDGYACARILHLRGIRVSVLPVGRRDHMTEETRRQAEVCRRLGIPLAEGGTEELRRALREADVIVDAILGIGLTGEVKDACREVIEEINASGRRVVAVDIPSGIQADTGEILGSCVRADSTVTMQCAKPGLLLDPGSRAAGKLRVAEIGVQVDMEALHVRSVETEDLRDLLPKRDPMGNKGTFGKVLIAAGSFNMAGAAVLAAKAALKTGAGMVRVLTCEANRMILQTAVPEALLDTWETEEEAKAALLRGLVWSDSVVIGPGLGTGETAASLVNAVLGCPDARRVVLDADALNLIAASPELLRGLKEAGSDGERQFILTPHVGEMSRLTGRSIEELKRDPLTQAASFSKGCVVTCVLKDARTVTADRDGRLWINRNGNSGMATAGSGDVLAGIIGSLLVQGTDPSVAAPAGVCLHGAAGDLAAAGKSQEAMTAGDIAEEIGHVLLQLGGPDGDREYRQE